MVVVFPLVSVTVVSGGGGLGAKGGETLPETGPRSWRDDTSLGWRDLGEGGSAGSSTAASFAAPKDFEKGGKF